MSFRGSAFLRQHAGTSGKQALAGASRRLQRMPRQGRLSEEFTGMSDKYLIIGPSWLGDMVMAQSLFMLLRKKHPRAEIHVTALPFCVPLVKRMPEVDKVIPIPFGHGQLRIMARRRFGKALASEHYTEALILPHSLKSALIPFFAGIPVRRGWLGESRHFLLNQIWKDKKPFPLMVDQYRALAWDPKDENAPRSADEIDLKPVPLLSTDAGNARDVYERLGGGSTENILAICPGASYGPAKKWPAESFAAVASWWIGRGGRAVIMGAGKEREDAAAILAALRPEAKAGCLDLTGKTSITDSVDLMALAGAVLTNDSGLMHVAAATGRPVVAVFGSSTPCYTPPLTEKAGILQTDIKCRPCFRRTCKYGHYKCLRDISPEMAEAALVRLLSAGGSSSAENA